jgi:hypothetical protein
MKNGVLTASRDQMMAETGQATSMLYRLTMRSPTDEAMM